MARVAVSTVAQADTATILRDLAAKAGWIVAADYAASFEALYDRLTAHPDSGAPSPAYGRHVRIGLVRPHLNDRLIAASAFSPGQSSASIIWFRGRVAVPSVSCSSSTSSSR